LAWVRAPGKKEKRRVLQKVTKETKGRKEKIRSWGRLLFGAGAEEVDAALGGFLVFVVGGEDGWVGILVDVVDEPEEDLAGFFGETLAAGGLVDDDVVEGPELAGGAAFGGGAGNRDPEMRFVDGLDVAAEEALGESGFVGADFDAVFDGFGGDGVGGVGVEVEADVWAMAGAGEVVEMCLGELLAGAGDGGVDLVGCETTFDGVEAAVESFGECGGDDEGVHGETRSEEKSFTEGNEGNEEEAIMEPP
jgi:hypothetical protein